MECIHQKVCKHKSDGDYCVLVEICKFYFEKGKVDITFTGPVKLKIKKKRGRPRKILNERGARRKNYSHLTTNEEDIKKAREVLKERKKYGRLTDNQIAALETTKGFPYKSLTEPQKQQILDIVKQSSNKKADENPED